ncbi:MAG: inositol monophosphatase family protein [Acidobacteriaceae bacterium]
MSGSRVPADLELASQAAHIALEAGALLRDFFHRGVVTEYKGEVDVVTEADRASEKLIAERLTAAFPDHGIYGEEGARRRIEAEYRWYVDPLDGTTNFSHGFPVFCVSLGLEHRPPGLPDGEDGTLIAGVVYDPTRDELFSAEKDRGAWLNGRRIHASRTATLSEALIATGFPSRKRHVSPNIHFYQEFTLRSHGVRRAGSAALDLAYTACGRLDGFWEFHLNPWDTAAGALLVLESGGAISRFDGGAFQLDSREVLVTNGLIHGEMTTLFADMFAGRDLHPIPTPREYAAARAAREAQY